MADNTVDSILLEINATTDKADGGIGKTIKNLKSLKEVTEGIDTDKLLTIRDVFNDFKTAGESLKQAGDGMRSIASAVKSLSGIDSNKLKEVASAVEKIGAGLGNLGSNNKISIQIDSNGISKAVKPLQEVQAAAAKSGILEPYKDFEARLQNVGRNFSFSGSGQELADEIAKAEARLDSLIAKEEKLKVTGGANENSQSYRSLQYDIAEVCNRLDVLYDRMQNETAAAQNATIVSEQVRSAMEGAAQSAERLSSAEDRTASAGNAAAAAQQALSGALNQTNTNSANAQIQGLINKINEYKATISGMESGKQLFDSQSYEEAVNGLARVQEQFKQYQESVKNAPKSMEDVAKSIKSIGDAAGKCGLGTFSSILNNISAMLPTIEMGGMAANAGFQSMAVGLQAVQSAIPIIGIILTLISALVNAVNAAANKIKTAFGKISAGFKTLVNKIRVGITKMMNTLGEWKNKFLEMFGVQENSFESLKKKLKTLTRLFTFMALRKIITKIFEGAAEGFQNLAKYSKIYGTAFNNNVSLLYSDLKWLGNSISTAFEPILNYITPILDMLITKLVEATRALAQFFSALTGKKFYTKAIKNWHDYADSIKSATKAVKDYTIGIDELNILNDNNGSGAGADAIDPGDMFETEEVESKYKDLADMIREAWENADFYDLGRLLGEKLKEALESIPWDKIKATLRKIAKCIATFLNGFLETPGLFTVIGATIAEAINSAFEFVDSFVENFHWESLGRAICDLIIGALDTIDWPLIRKTVAGLAQGLVDAINVALQTDELWIKLGTAIANTINAAILFAKTGILGLDWASLGRSVGNLLGNALAGIDYEGIGVSFAGFVNGIFTAVLNFSKTFPWTEVAANFANGINTAIGNLDWNTIKSGFTLFCAGLGKNLDAAIRGIDWKQIGKALGDGINTLIRGIGSFIASIDPVELGNSIADFINGAFEAFNSKDAVKTINMMIEWVRQVFATVIKNVDWQEVMKDIGTLLAGIDWYKIFSICFTAIAGVWTFKKIFKTAAIEAIGTHIVLGIHTGIIKALANIGAWLKEHFVDPIVNAVKKLFGIHSPSTVFEEIGNNLIQGFLNGISGLISSCKQTITEWAQKIKDWFSGASFGGINLETWANYAGNIISGFKDKITNAYSTVKDSVSTWASKVKEWFNSSSFGGVNSSTWTTYANDIITSFKDKVSNAYTTTKESITTWAAKAKEWFNSSSFGAVNSSTWTSYANDIITGFKDKVGNAYTTTKDNITVWATKLKEWFNSSSFGGINNGTWTSYANDIITGFKTKVGNTYATTKDNITTWASKLKEWFNSSSFGGINNATWTTYASNVITSFKDKIGNAYGTTQSCITTWASALKNWFSGSGYGNITNGQWSTYAGNIISGFKSKISSSYTECKSGIETWASNVKTWFTNKCSSSTFYNVASDVISGFKNGIGELYSTCKDNITSWGSSIISWFKDKLGVQSPSKVFQEIGGFTVAGFNKGLTASGKATRGIVQTWADSFSDVDIGFKVGVDTSALKEYQNNYGADFTNKAMIERVEREVTTNGAVKATLNTSGGVKEVLTETIREVMPVLSEIATNTKIQADKEEQTVVQIGNKTITDAVETQQSANGYRFRPA